MTMLAVDTQHLAAAAEAQGLTTGIRWGLSPRLIVAIDTAIANQDWQAEIKVGGIRLTFNQPSSHPNKPGPVSVPLSGSLGTTGRLLP